MGSTQDELLGLFNSFLQDMNGGIGISKADSGVHTMDNTNFGNLMPRQAVEEMVDMTRDESGWLKSINTVTRHQMAGTVPIVRINQPVTVGVGEGEGTAPARRQVTSRANYSCKKFKSMWVTTWEDLREAKAAGIQQFNEKMRKSFFTAIGNDMAWIILASDTSRGALTDWDRLLNRLDGVQKQLDSANVYNAAGKAFGSGMFAMMKKKMPAKYASDPNLRFFFNATMNTLWKHSLTNTATTQKYRSAVGDAALTTVQEFSPMGIPPLIVPQMLDNQGPTAIAPTSVADDGDGTATIVLTTLVTAAYVATVALGADRIYIVKNLVTGHEEFLTGVDASSTLTVYSAGAFGQDTISTTASDYSVTLADESDCYLMNPKVITAVHCDQMRSYTKHNVDNDWFETIVYHDMDVLVPTPEVAVKFKRVQLPDITTW
jgi:hypothetical protein